jgi:MFS family permease
MLALLARIAPPPGVARALTVRSVVYAVGMGVFQAGSAVFFTRYLGLSATQVGVALSVAGALTVLGSVPIGTAVDRFGARRTWLLAGLVEAAAFASYPLARSFVAFLGVACVVALTDLTTSVAKHAYTLHALPAGERVRALAYQRSALNVGFTVGAGCSGAALALGTRSAYLWLVVANAAVLLVTAAVIARLPRVAPARPRRDGGSRFAVLRDGPFVRLSAVNGVLQGHQTLFTIVLPLWVVTMTDAPAYLVPILFMVNTVMAVTLQVRTSRGSETLPGAAGALRTAGATIAVAALLLAATTLVHGYLAVALLVIGAATLTLGELTQSAGAWGVSAVVPPEDRRGEYIGAFKLGGQLQQTFAPAGLTFLAVGTGGWGWLAVAALMLVAGAYAARAVHRVAATPRLHHPAPTAEYAQSPA